MLHERSMMEQERAGLRDELLRVERDKLDVETEKSGTPYILNKTRYNYN